ncbi:hypothetical protein, partial [Mesomycoplasma ovipneumoniae]|uniref:hypothetical protein n=1 Tax=Mesomycoplasma ovipneumoniae TaxID=29562 RepID=UPI0029650D1A
RAIPRLSGNQGLSIQTGLAGGGTGYNAGTWKILYVKNKEGSKNKPDLSKVDLTWDFNQQKFNASRFQNQEHKSSWIVSITSNNGNPLLYDPLNYYAMLGPFRAPELPE